MKNTTTQLTLAKDLAGRDYVLGKTVISGQLSFHHLFKMKP